MDSKDTDIELVAACKKDNRHAFNQLVTKYKDEVFNISYSFLRNHEDADDCTQEVFIKVYRYIKNFKGDSLFSTWLYKITVNTCKNKINSTKYKCKKILNRFLYDDCGNLKDYIENLADKTMPIIESLEMKERACLIQAAISTLPHDHKTAIILRDIQGHSYDHIAEICDWKCGTVKSRIARARSTLKEKLKEIL